MKRLFEIQWICVAVCLLFSLTGCNVKRPETVFPDDLMENILYDYHIAKAMAENLPYNENCKKVLYVESVFKKHGVTEAQFDSSLVWFSRHPDVLAKIYEQVKERLRAERDGINQLIAIRDNKPLESLPGDSIDVWIGRRIYQFTGMPLDNKLAFTIPSDTNFKQRDTLVWSVRFSCLEPDTVKAPQMALQIFYKKDTLVCGPKPILSNGVHSLMLSADTLGELKEINGFIYIPMRDSLQHILLDSITLMRYHATDTLKLDTLKQVSVKNEQKSEKKMDVVKDAKPLNLDRRPMRPRPQLKID